MKKIGRKGKSNYADAIILCQCPKCNSREQFFLIYGDPIVQCMICKEPYDKIKHALKRTK